MKDILQNVGITYEHSGVCAGSTWLEGNGGEREIHSPIDGHVLALVRETGSEESEEVIVRAREAFLAWCMVPAPRRGELVRRIGLAVREHKEALSRLITVETGKILTEARGEVQEMIDMCDFAVGQSRMLYGRTIASERPRHAMFEKWHPLGPVGVITAFNFPLAVWSWNAMIALVAGDTVVWKPSSKTPLSAIAIMKLATRVIQEEGCPNGLLNLVVGSSQTIGETLIADRRLPLISATGSVAMGRRVARVVSDRLGKTILELGGNNAIIVMPSANLQLAVRAITFGAVGTAGQRCTTTRRLIIHREIYDGLTQSLLNACRQIPIGNPLDEGVLMGPLIDRNAVHRMQEALATLKSQGGRILCGGEVLAGGLFDAGTYVAPCLAEADSRMPLVQEETFAPLLYLMPADSLEEAIRMHNDVPQGLTSAIFTRDIREAEAFLSAVGSDCGIANVNIGTSGAEIGGAFGGEKDSGGGREAGSDAWKAYMRRQTSTINWSDELPLAQGVRFEVE